MNEASFASTLPSPRGRVCVVGVVSVVVVPPSPVIEAAFVCDVELVDVAALPVAVVAEPVTFVLDCAEAVVPAPVAEP
ncbi:MAG: hypothetical protein IKG98_04020 [Ruminococcus sp.]|nr:hypothetical protein [Ruminococcus sp.]